MLFFVKLRGLQAGSGDVLHMAETFHFCELLADFAGTRKAFAIRHQPTAHRHQRMTLTAITGALNRQRAMTKNQLPALLKSRWRVDCSRGKEMFCFAENPRVSREAARAVTRCRAGRRGVARGGPEVVRNGGFAPDAPSRRSIIFPRRASTWSRAIQRPQR